MADVVDYPRLMDEDEEGTLVAVTSHIGEVFESEITGRRGRLFKTMCDAVLAGFASFVDAVQCAVAARKGCKSETTGSPKTRPLSISGG